MKKLRNASAYAYPVSYTHLKAAGESVAKPWEYYENNIAGTLTLVDVM